MPSPPPRIDGVLDAIADLAELVTPASASVAVGTSAGIILAQLSPASAQQSSKKTPST